jgi:redox-sensitive bicupin YhaK (pirin superfamily)
MPKQEHGLMRGFQLWVNLPAAQKMTAPRYQDIAPEKIPEVTIGAARVRVIAGEIAGTRGPVEGIATSPAMLDVTLAPGATFEHALPPEHNAFVYVFEGDALVGAEKKRVARRNLAVLGEGDAITIAAEGEGARFLVLAGRPLNEPVARYGPFVMNTREELVRAFDDYRAGRLAR